MLITDPTSIERYNEETLPSVRTLITDWNRNAPQDTLSEANRKSTNNDTTEFVTGNKRPAIKSTEAIEPDPKRIELGSQ
jgi:hypothetical protein